MTWWTDLKRWLTYNVFLTRKALKGHCRHEQNWGWDASNAFGRWDWSGYAGWHCTNCGEESAGDIGDYTCPACEGHAEWGNAGPTLMPKRSTDRYWSAVQNNTLKTPLAGRAYNWLMNVVWLQWFHTIKAIICVWLNRWLGTTSLHHNPERRYYSVHVAYLRGGSGFTGEFTQYWHEALVVGYGLLEWWVEERGDSSP